NSMGFYNVQNGDAPLFKRLAEEYTISDNYHQPVMGGTAVQHTMLMTGDQMFWEPSGSIPAQPPTAAIVDPTPKTATNVAFTRGAHRAPGPGTRRGSPAPPGARPIVKHRAPRRGPPPGAPPTGARAPYYITKTPRRGSLPTGPPKSPPTPAGTAVPPSSLRTI